MQHITGTCIHRKHHLKTMSMHASTLMACAYMGQSMRGLKAIAAPGFHTLPGGPGGARGRTAPQMHALQFSHGQRAFNPLCQRAISGVGNHIIQMGVIQWGHGLL